MPMASYPQQKAAYEAPKSKGKKSKSKTKSRGKPKSETTKSIGPYGGKVVTTKTYY